VFDRGTVAMAQIDSLTRARAIVHNDQIDHNTGSAFTKGLELDGVETSSNTIQAT